MEAPIKKRTLPVKSNVSYFVNTNKPGLKLFSSGCATLDCVLGGGFVLGRVCNIIGDFATGKTLVAIEACMNFLMTYPNGRVCYFESEAAFDQEYARSLGMPIEKVEFVAEPLENLTVESWFENVEKVLDELDKLKQPCIYVLDSLDALSDQAELGRKIDEGSFGGNKPKKVGELFRKLVQRIKRSNMCLMIVSQVRDNIGVTFGERHRRSGGRALDFYSSQNLWLAHTKQLKKMIDSVERVVGVMIKANVKKNKIGLPFRTCDFPIYFGYGIDDIESMILWLDEVNKLDHILPIINKYSEIEKKEVTKRIITNLLAKIEDDQVDNFRIELSELVKNLWQEIETEFLPKRSKYHARQESEIPEKTS